MVSDIQEVLRKWLLPSLSLAARNVSGIYLMDVTANLELETRSASNIFSLGVAWSSAPRAVLAYSWHSIDELLILVAPLIPSSC